MEVPKKTSTYLRVWKLLGSLFFEGIPATKDFIVLLAQVKGLCYAFYRTLGYWIRLIGHSSLYETAQDMVFWHS